ncbi:DUF3052 domain-containing protein [Fulvivirga ligni]|uniref:DUF3052 domain-containing protein n=1 Tax=Fulvivirga ligni TaxID=2904246 RepID=UPI001F19D16E|nr:DUF3052 domain-containing protein [Fulvivirga ligni]UII23373.1 DUF3052 domain-containing protein [Fulvivirga ligni]
MKNLKLDPMAGYSGTPLAKKLGIKSGHFLRLLNQPAYYHELFNDFPDNVNFEELNGRADIIHFFTQNAYELMEQLPLLKGEIKQNGMIWVSWPKKASKVPTDVTEDVIRDLALKIGLVDVKVCAVDDVWSGLKLVIPLKDRK